MAWHRLRAWCAAFVMLGTVDAVAMANTISGVASVIDGDTIEIRGERIRIMSIDAPELDQICIDPGANDTWHCGQEAARALWDFLSQYAVTCETSGTDYAGRWFAYCNVPGMSIATWMAGNGWAIPNQNCRCEEVRAWARFAESKGVGIWRSAFQMPWEWRKAHQQ